MFDQLNFKTVTTAGRSTSNDPVSITHSHKTKKNEILFRLSRETMDKCGFTYGCKVHIQFAAEGTVCRILKSDASGAMKLGQQTKDNESSAGIVRLTYKDVLPNFLKIESEKDAKEYVRVRYINQDDMIQYEDDTLTFQLKRIEAEQKKS
ncbi:hypothetical protein [Photobacterium sanguinicancri]|uniref:PilZ domain-containing protein n=1 Tax=Photobacterium sanguinicancri TaxID=875932 RepID=A0AAW7YCA8_9GAMM|nr:hypothetical protein [Photobacterium sanguinicancri]MDO6544285.1 hypothetical protein [Photobacterium sanguinicancri]